MPRTIESIVDNHNAATERRKAGKPVWDRHLRITHLIGDGDSTESVQKAGREIAAILKTSAWLKADQEEHGERLGDGEVKMAAEEFEDITDLDHFNAVLDNLYDLADADRVWIA